MSVKALRLGDQPPLMIEGAQDGFWDCDLIEQEIFWNDRLYQLLGLTAPARMMPCRNLLAYLHPDDIPAVIQEITAFFMGTDTHYETELRLRHASGQYRYFLCRGKVLRNELGNPERFAGSLTDITRYKTVEQDLQRHNEKLLESNKDLEQFTFIASHDLRTPLRKALTFCKFLKATMPVEPHPDAHQWLKRMEASLNSMQNLIDGLLSYSRLANNEIKREPVSLQGIMAGILNDFEEQIAESDAEIVVDNLPIIEADSVQMRQLFQNLISNALKFHRPGIPPRIRVISELVREKGMGLPERCRIEVSDNGIGFDEKYAPWIFLMFQRLHGNSQVEGDGIGLAICKKILECHGGTIRVKSRVGHGTTFYLDLPICRPADTAAVPVS